MQCQARILTSFDRSEPRGRQCDRPADAPLCGVWLCWQHREIITEWIDGEERLSSRAPAEIAAWGVEPSGELVPFP